MAIVHVLCNVVTYRKVGSMKMCMTGLLSATLFVIGFSSALARPQFRDSLKTKTEALPRRVGAAGIIQKETMTPKDRLFDIVNEGDMSSIINTLLFLQTRLDRLQEEVLRLRRSGRGIGLHPARMETTRQGPDGIIEIVASPDEPASAPPERNKTHEITGFADLVVSAIRNRAPGLQLEAVYTSDIFSNVVGGLRRKTVYLDNVDLTVSLDLEDAFHWHGANFFLYALGNNGGSPSENTGDLQTISNIDAPDAWKLYEMWLQQTWLDGRLSVRAGFYDLNSEFDVIEAGGLFLNSSHGIGPDFSQTGLNGPSIFPNTSLGFRAKVRWNSSLSWQTVILDGVPDGDGFNGLHVELGGGDGVLVCSEINHVSRTADDETPDTKLAAGIYLYSRAFSSILAPERKIKSRPGGYVLAEHTIFREAADSRQGLTIFGRVGLADSRIAQFSSYTGAGLVYTGLLRGRETDQIGLAVAAAHNGENFIRAEASSGTQHTRAEIAVELTYRAQIRPWFAVQPDVQYVIDPGTLRNRGNALSLGGRLEISL